MGNSMQRQFGNVPFRAALFVFLTGVFAGLMALSASAQTGAWLTHSHDEQHSALSTVQSQPLSSIHWHTPVDLNPPQGEIFIHYGSPLVTAANTVIVPVKTGTNSFRVEARNGLSGKRLWMHKTGYQTPAADFIPGIGPTISGSQLFIPDIAGGVLVRQNPDQKTGAFSHLYFYGLKNYKKAPATYQQNVQTDTPLSTDASGNLFFGFVVLGPTPLNLQSGLARIAADGTGSWVSAATLSGDPSMARVSVSCAPALSPDGRIRWLSPGGKSDDPDAHPSRPPHRSLVRTRCHHLRCQFIDSHRGARWRCLLRRTRKSVPGA
jgi:hypothetical protein